MQPIRLCYAGVALATVGMVLAAAGCASSTPSTAGAGTGAATSAPATETNPAGDIPDSQVYVPFTPPSGRFTVSVPEGWARSDQGGAITFTDKLNSVRIETVSAATAPTVSSAKASEVPAIRASAQGFVAGDVTTVTRKAGDAVLIKYTAMSAADPVTGKSVKDAVERYEFWKGGDEVVLTLSGPVGADNVDPWKTVTDSFSWNG